MKRKFVLVSVVLVILLISVSLSALVYWYGSPSDDGMIIRDVSFSNNWPIGFDCEVADVPAEWTRGLSGRSELAPMGGMLFIFPSPSRQTFWMKGTLIPLDIIFVWANGTVGAIYEAPVEPGVSDNDLMRYESPGLVKWVVELNMGVCADLGIIPGVTMSISNRD